MAEGCGIVKAIAASVTERRTPRRKKKIWQHGGARE